MNQTVILEDWGLIDYKTAWDRQEVLLNQNVAIKLEARKKTAAPDSSLLPTRNFFIFCEHLPVYTLGKSGKIDHVLLSDDELAKKGIEFFKTNRGGDITFHGPDQIVGYPILDLEKFTTDIGLYLRNIEQVIIDTIAEYGIKGERSHGETGVWVDALVKGRERKICAIGVRCSRWVTMHGFALNVNTDLNYFNHIVPCGIQDKQVTSLANEVGKKVDMQEVKMILIQNFQKIFNVDIA